MIYKRLSIVLLVLLSPGITQLSMASDNKQPNMAPMVYVERCSFQYAGEKCGGIAKNVIFFSADELLSFTEDWAVGRKGDYKMYLSCLDPKNGRLIDGKLSLITIVVAGPGLGKSHEIAKQLLSDFASELPENMNNITHCLTE